MVLTVMCSVCKTVVLITVLLWAVERTRHVWTRSSTTPVCVSQATLGQTVPLHLTRAWESTATLATARKECACVMLHTLASSVRHNWMGSSYKSPSTPSATLMACVLKVNVVLLDVVNQQHVPIPANTSSPCAWDQLIWKSALCVLEIKEFVIPLKQSHHD